MGGGGYRKKVMFDPKYSLAFTATNFNEPQINVDICVFF